MPPYCDATTVTATIVSVRIWKLRDRGYLDNHEEMIPSVATRTRTGATTVRAAAVDHIPQVLRPPAKTPNHTRLQAHLSSSSPSPTGPEWGPDQADGFESATGHPPVTTEASGDGSAEGWS